MWYQRKLDIPAAWTGKKIYLNFGAVDYKAEIYIDGKFVTRHFGGSSSFSVDLSRYVQPGKSFNLVVYVEDHLRGGRQIRRTSFVPMILPGILPTMPRRLWVLPDMAN